MTVSFFAGLLTLFYFFLTWHVTRCRRQYRIPLFDQGNETLQRAIRAHANFIEYTPLFLILIFLAQKNGLSVYILSVLGFLFVIARVVHAYGILKVECYDPANLTGFKHRCIGMVLTMLILAVLAGILLTQCILQW